MDGRLHGAPGHIVGAAEQRDHERGRRRHHARRQAPHERQQLAALIQAIQAGNELGRRLEPRRRVGLDAPRHDPLERLGNLRIHRSERRRGCLHAALQVLELVAVLPRSEQHVRHNQPQRVNVGALIDRLAPGLLGRHVGHRAHDGAGHGGLRHVPALLPHGWRERPGRQRRARPRRRGSRNAKIHDDGVLAFDHDVGGLQIAMHDTRFVRRLQPGCDLPHDPERLGHRQLAGIPQHRRQIRALEVRHRDVLDAVDFAEVVNADDVLVRDLPCEQQLLLEPALDRARGIPIARRLGTDHFHRDHDVELGVPRLIHGAHPAHAEHADDPIARPEPLPGGQRAGAGGSPAAGQKKGGVVEAPRQGRIVIRR